ncbi:MAG: tetratricopeptide repeat protein, partial [Anaerolineales bacterium]|nr:tetratricopeptide repeat protein [Anaerolineales bacterium]
MPSNTTTPAPPDSPTAVLPTTETLAQLAQTDDESAWTAAFVQLADHLLLADPTALLQLIHDYRDHPLHLPHSQHQFAYFTALALRKNNQLSEAIDQFTTLLARPDLPPALRARALNSRAVGYRLRGELVLAQAGYAQSLALWRELDDVLNVGKVQLNMGIIAYQLRRYAEAEAHLQEAAACFTAVNAPQWLAGVTNELGLLHRDQGRLDDALVQFNRFLAQRQAEGASDQIGLAYLNRGEILLFQEKLDEAEASLQAALAHMSSSPYRVDVYLHLGLITAVRGDLSAALRFFQQAQQTTYALGRSEILPHVYYHLADTWWRLGQPKTARHYLETAVAVIEQQQSQPADESVSISLLGRWQQVYEALFLVQMALGQPNAALATAERARARAFAQRLNQHAPPENWVTADDLQRQLAPGQAFISYFTT